MLYHVRLARTQAYRQNVTIRNTLNSHVEATLRAGSHERWTLSQQHISLKPQQSVDVQLQLKVLRFAQRRKALTQGQRDVFHISAPYFEQKWHATFFLAASDGNAAAAATSSNSTAAATPEGSKALTGSTQQQRRQHALKALVRRKRSSAVGQSPAASLAAQPALHPRSGVEAQDDGLPSLEDLAAASDTSVETHDWQQPPLVPPAAQSSSTFTSSGRRQTSSQAACNAALPDQNGPCIAAADHSAGLDGAEADGCCPCRCHGADPGPAGTTLAAEHRSRELQLQLETAAHKIELLQQALSDRDSTIRCSDDEETKLQSCTLRIA